MSESIYPKHYDEWKKCITERCRIKLTPEYVGMRLKALNDSQDQDTAKFKELYGDTWLKRVIGYFEEAKLEVK